MTGWLLDTNVASELFRDRPDPPVAAWAAGRGSRSVFISVLTLAEYDKAIAHVEADDRVRERYASQRDALQAEYGRRILSVSDAIVRRWGVITGEVKRRTGHPPPVIDTLLAATALEHGLTLVTRNTRDVQHSGAQLFNPWLG